jgi:hypothetical protein
MQGEGLPFHEFSRLGGGTGCVRLYFCGSPADGCVDFSRETWVFNIGWTEEACPLWLPLWSVSGMKSRIPVSRISPMARLLVSASLVLLPSAFVHAQSTGGDQYTGVARPPADDAIVANEDVVTAAPRKPLPGTPVAAPASTAHAALAENPDYGIVTSTTHSQAETAPAPATAEERNAHLIARPGNPDYGIVGMVPSPSNQLPEGTDIHVRLLGALSTQRSQSGEPFRAQVASDVYKEGRVVIPMGSELRGRVTEVTQGHRLGGHATIRLRPDAVILPDGTAYHLYAQAIASSQPGTHTDGEGGIQPKAHMVKDLAEYGGGAGGGAIVGGVLGGPIGAGAGAIVGAGVVTTHLLLQKPAQAQVEEGSEIVFSLTEPMELLPTRN